MAALTPLSELSHPFYDTIQTIERCNLSKRQAHLNTIVTQTQPVEARSLWFIHQLPYASPQGESDATWCHTFWSNGELGFKLRDAMTGDWRSVPDNADCLVEFSQRGHPRRAKVSHRIRVLGLDGRVAHASNRIVSARCITPTDPCAALTCRTVVKHVSRTVRQMLPPGAHWELWHNGQIIRIAFEDIILVRIINVGEGSWQPLLAYLA